MVVEALQKVPEPAAEERSDDDRCRRAVIRHIRRGEPRKAAQVLQSEGLVKMDPEGIAQLRALHPRASDPTPPVKTPIPPFGSHPSAPTISAVIEKAPPNSCPGASGWSFSMTKLAYGIPAFKTYIDNFFRRIVADKEVALKGWFTASVVVPLRKKGGQGIRPIAIGEAWIRLAARWALGTVRPSEALTAESYGLSKGGSEPVIWSARDAVPSALNTGLLKIDFSNAFNTLSRHATAQAIQDSPHSRHLLGIYRFLYQRPSHLLVSSSSGETVMLSSDTGGRQGDPLFPFLFSLTISPLVQELAARFAQNHDFTSGDGNLTSRRLIWALLDDLSLVLRPGATAQDVIAFLSSPAIIQKYGLEINLVKTEFVAGPELRDQGTGLLGSWVGGPDSVNSTGSNLTEAACDKLQHRISLLDSLDLHDRLCLLRSCYFPVLNHLLRTLLPNVGAAGARRFDNIISTTIARYADDRQLPASATQISQLPKRLGGLGLFSQSAIKPLAAASSFVMSYGALHDRGLPLSPRSRTAMDQALRLCASNLNIKPVEKLLSPEERDQPNIQARATAFLHETTWLGLFQRATPNDKVRLLENCGALARGWLSALPLPGTTMLSNNHARYALRRTLLSPFADITTASGPCPRCSCPDHPTHHLACRITGPLRTIRHTAIKDIIIHKIRESGKEARAEEVVGMLVDQGNGPVRVIADITTILDGHRENLDVTIRHIPPLEAAFPTPQPAEIQAALDASRLIRPDRLHPVLSWDDIDDDGPIHPVVQNIRMFRRLASDKVIHPVIRAAEAQKRAHYAKVHQSVLPVTITANGVLSASARAAFNSLAVQSNPSSTTEQVKFRDRLIHRLSVSLIQHACRMGTICADRALNG